MAGWRPVLLLLTVLLAACARGEAPPTDAGADPLAPLPAGEGRIVFYRTGNPFLGAVTPAIVVNGREVGDLAPGETFFRNAAPGRYEVLLDTAPDRPIEFRVQPGQRRFVQVAPQWDFLGWSLQPALTAAEEARGDLQDLTVTGGYGAGE